MAISRTGYEAATGTYATNGAAIPAAAGETAVTAVVGGGNMTALTTGAAVGSRALQFNPVASQFLANKITLAAPTGVLAFDMVLRIPSVVTDEQHLFQARNGTANAVIVSYLPAGFLRVRSSGSTTLWTSTVAVPLGSYVKIAGAFDFAGGRFKAGMFTPGTLTPIAAGASTDWVTTALAQTAVDSFQVGKVSSNADVTSFVLDEVRWDPAATDYIAATASSLTISLNVTPASGPAPLAVTATTTVSNAVGTKTYAFNWGDGQTTAAQASTTATHTYAAAGTYTVTVTVPDN